ncbi:hypothetical protein SS50377_28410 [Spironucleus salmonicida]|uniref:Uncharacterized protein n=1 Tax=Spironucleus salmonicida TaxID=348837 RepID=V6LF88_9EUKA|nr:hypothetical protein SS50377_28410 [Spironucleus salmonicida]|eukprot:EST43185.1 hypothetical protein SS50377_17126 [Spironucleus salmonicida]
MAFKQLTSLNLLQGKVDTTKPILLMYFSTYCPLSRKIVDNVIAKDIPNCEKVFIACETPKQVAQYIQKYPKEAFAVDQDDLFRSFLYNNVPKLATNYYIFLLKDGNVLWKGVPESGEFNHSMQKILG